MKSISLKGIEFLLILISFITIILSYLVLFVFKGEDLFFWIKEDGFFEYGSALWYFLSSILLLVIYFKYTEGNNFLIFRTKRNLFILLLGLLFFVAAGEEISWGQRIFNIDTPENIKDINAQGELNIHNLNFFHGKDEFGNRKEGLSNWLTLGRIFFIFWVLYCVVIPILNKVSVKVSKILKSINLPIVHLGLSAFFALNYVLSRIIIVINDNVNEHAVVEIKEANTGFLFLSVAILFFANFYFEKKSI